MRKLVSKTSLARSLGGVKMASWTATWVGCSIVHTVKELTLVEDTGGLADAMNIANAVACRGGVGRWGFGRRCELEKKLASVSAQLGAQ